MISEILVISICLLNPTLGVPHSQYDDYFHNLTTPQGPTQTHTRPPFPRTFYEIDDYWSGELGWALDTYASVPRYMVLETAKLDWAVIRSIVTGDTDLGDAIGALMQGDMENDSAQDVIDLMMGELSILVSCAVFLVSFPLVLLVGLCFCCCRCCGRCGGKLSVSRARKQIQACSIIIAIFLLVFLVLNLFGATTTAFVGLRLDFAVTTLEDSATLTLQDSQAYMRTAAEQLDRLAVKELNITLTEMKHQLSASGSIVSLPLMVHMLPSMRNLLNSLATIQQATNDLDVALNKSDWHSDRLSSQGAQLQLILESVAGNMTDLHAGCAGANFTNATCSSLPTGDMVDTSYNFSSSLDLTAFTTLKNDIQDLQLNNTLKQASQSYEDIPYRVASSINSSLDDIYDVIDNIDTAAVEDAIRDIKEPMEELEETLHGYEDDIPEQREDFQLYIDLWFQSFVGITSLVLSTVFLVFCGFFCGCLGKKVDSAPQKRSKISHCGGHCLMCSVCLSFPIAAFFALIGAIFLLAFGNVTLICSSLEDESIFQELVDYEGVLGTNLVADALPFNGTENLTVQEVLTSCRNGDTLYTTFHLDSMFDVTSFVDLQQVRDDINVTSLQTLAEDAVSSVTVVDNETVNNMATVQAAWPPPITVHLLIQEHTNALSDLKSNLSYLAPYLNSLANITEFINTDYQYRYRELGYQVEDLFYYELADIQTDLDDLEQSLYALVLSNDQLNVSLQNVEVEAVVLQQILSNNGSDKLVEGAEFLVDEIIGIAQDYVDFVDDKLRNDIGECTLVSHIYDAVVQSLCYQILNVMNCVWFGLLAMVILLITQLILATKLVKYLRIPHDAASYYEPPQERPRPGGLAIGRPLEPCMSELRRTVLANESLAFAGETMCAPTVLPTKR